MAKDDVKPCVSRTVLLCRYNVTLMGRQLRQICRRIRMSCRMSVASLLIAYGAAALAAPPSPSQKASASPTAGETGTPSARSATASLRWPLQIPGEILSSFGEYRYDHLHAGIDISTAGDTGYKVLAAASGVVFRLKVEWRGYGRALDLRDAGDAPVDPFEAGLPRPADRRPPVPESLTVTAASASTFIDGDAREVVYPIRREDGGLSTTAIPVKVNGPFLAALAAYDPAGNAGRAGIGSIEVRVDGEVRYRLSLRSFRFDQYPQSGLVFDHRFSRLAPAAFSYRLFRLPGNDFGRAPIDEIGRAHV